MGAFSEQSAANWTAQNPTLGKYQFGIESDTGKAKRGDGVTAWNDLAYFDPAASGYIPQNSKSLDYTLVAGDSGKHIFQTGASKTVTIPANASVAFAIGTAVTFIATDASGCSIAITSDTMTLANSTTTGTRTLAQNGIATAIKITATSWIISGAGLT